MEWTVAIVMKKRPVEVYNRGIGGLMRHERIDGGTDGRARPAYCKQGVAQLQRSWGE